MATQLEKNTNSKNAFAAVKKLAEEEKHWVEQANHHGSQALSAISAANKVSWWNATEGAWKSARIKALAIASHYQAVLDYPGEYWETPMKPSRDPMYVQTGVAAPSRSSTYASQQTAAAQQAAAAANPSKPKPPVIAGPIFPPGNGLSPVQPPILQQPPGQGPPVFTPPGQDPGTNGPPPQTGEPPLPPGYGEPGGPGGSPLGAPLPPGEGTPVAWWLVPVGLVGAIAWHLLGRGERKG